VIENGRPSRPQRDSGDRQAADVVEARLGRPPNDVLEATIVLEAWGGRPARRAMSAARALVTQDVPVVSGRSRVEPPEDREHQSVVGEGIALVLSILSVASWANPLSSQLGSHLLELAIRIALPIAVALQWGLRSRYLSRRRGLALLAHDGIVACGLALLLVEVPLVLLFPWGPVTALLVAIWVGGAVLTRRGWGLLYALGLVAGTIMLDRANPAYVVLGSLAAFTLALSVAAVLTRRAPTNERAGGKPRALLAALLGMCVGVLLVADPSLGWGVHGIHPAIALIPSVVGSFWGGYHLWSLYEAIPRGLSGVPLDHANRVGFSDPAMQIFLGAVVRLVGASVVLSAIVIVLGRWTHGTDALGVFVAFGCIGLVTMTVGLLESLSLQRAALIAVLAALVTEVSWHYYAPWHVPGGALAAGAAVGVLLTLPPLITLLSRSGRVLATTLWIQ
jgi:hypothetical protein